MRIQDLLLWFFIIVTLIITIGNLLCIREIMVVMDTMNETDNLILYLMDYKGIMTLI